MKDHTLDEAILEAARFIKAAKKLRALQKVCLGQTVENRHHFNHAIGKRKAEVERAALDCRYKLADLRQGR